MALPVTGQAQGVILTQSQKAGSPAAFSSGWHNELLLSELLPQYSYLVLQGLVFTTTFASGTVAAISPTSTGPFALFNPANSGKNLVMLGAAIPITTFTANSTGVGIGWQFVPNQTPTSTSAGNTPQNALIGSGNASVAKTYASGTLVGAPTVIGFQVKGAYLNLAAGDAVMFFQERPLGGEVIIGQNSGICLVMTGVLSFTSVPTYVWAELPA